MADNKRPDRPCDVDPVVTDSTDIVIKTEHDPDDVCKPDTPQSDLSTLDTSAMSHQDIMNRMDEELADLINLDPLLCHLPREITLEEVKSQITLEYGQAMTVFVRKADGDVLSVVVPQTGTVMDLKHAIQRHVILKLSREGGPQHISWRYVWKKHWLYYEGQKLTVDHKALKEYNIRNKDEVSFIKRLSER